MPFTRFTEITATSTKGLEAAIEAGVQKAVRAIPGVIIGVEVLSFSAKVQGEKIKEYRVKLKVIYKRF